MRLMFALLVALLSGAPALAQTSYLSVFATPERVYFVDTGTKKELPPSFSILVLVAIDPPLARGISAREMTVSVNCTANTFTIAGLVSLDRALKQVSTTLRQPRRRRSEARSRGFATICAMVKSQPRQRVMIPVSWRWRTDSG